jgi:hypothetical protein
MGWQEILSTLHTRTDARRIAIECYPGTLLEPLQLNLVPGLAPDLILESTKFMLSPPEIEAKFATIMGDDPVFGRTSLSKLDEFFDGTKI